MSSTTSPSRHRARRKWATFTAELDARIAGHEGHGRHAYRPPVNADGDVEIKIVADTSGFAAEVDAAANGVLASLADLTDRPQPGCLSEACGSAGTCQDPAACEAAEVEAAFAHRARGTTAGAA